MPHLEPRLSARTEGAFASSLQGRAAQGHLASAPHQLDRDAFQSVRPIGDAGVGEGGKRKREQRRSGDFHISDRCKPLLIRDRQAVESGPALLRQLDRRVHVRAKITREESEEQVFAGVILEDESERGRRRQRP